MGSVYEAVDERAGPTGRAPAGVALKVLSDSLAHDTATVRRFYEEARSAARLNHPHAVGIRDVGVSDGIHYLAMELVHGGKSVAERLRDEGPLPWREAVRIAAEIADALSAAHRAGLVHRDVKPGNILMTAEGSAKLADFGLAKCSDRVGETLTAAGHVVGTPDYMSPEQCEGRPSEARTDQYGLGATLYAMLTGGPPYGQAESDVERMYAHIHAPPPDPRTEVPTVPAEVSAVLVRAMSKRAEDRYGDASEMAAELRAALATGERREAEEADDWNRLTNATSKVRAVAPATGSARRKSGQHAPETAAAPSPPPPPLPRESEREWERERESEPAAPAAGVGPSADARTRGTASSGVGEQTAEPVGLAGPAGPEGSGPVESPLGVWWWAAVMAGLAVLAALAAIVAKSAATRP
jgi:serine/threonine protein kinase